MIGTTREDVLAHELVEACSLIEFLHDCLTKPHVKGGHGGYTYAYPETTLPRLARWRTMTVSAPACSAAPFSSKHDGPCPIHSESFQSLRAEMELGRAKHSLVYRLHQRFGCPTCWAYSLLARARMKGWPW